MPTAPSGCGVRSRRRAVVGLIGFVGIQLHAGCAASPPSGRAAAIASSSQGEGADGRSPRPAPRLDAPALPPSAAAVELTATLCAAADDGWFNLHPGGRILQGGCQQRLLAARVEPEGERVDLADPHLGVPSFGEGDLLQLSATVHGTTWLSIRDTHDTDTYSGVQRTVVMGETGGSWALRYRGKPIHESGRDDEDILGIGAWPGATIAVARSWDEQRVEVLAGTPSAPLPVLPGTHTTRLAEAATLASGHLYATHEEARHDGGCELLVWTPRATAPLVVSAPRMRLALPAVRDGRSLVARTPSEVFFVAHVDVVSGTIAVMRLDGGQLVRSGTFTADQLGTLAWSADGALWLLLGHSSAPGAPPSQLWRRPPGRADVWHPVAASELAAGTGLEAMHLLATGTRDVTFLGWLAGAGWGLYRVRLAETPSAAPSEDSGEAR